MSKRLDKQTAAAVGLLLDGAMRRIDTEAHGSHGLNGFAIAVAILDMLDQWDMLDEPYAHLKQRKTAA